jgi:hypothetical protein
MAEAAQIEALVPNTDVTSLVHIDDAAAAAVAAIGWPPGR